MRRPPTWLVRFAREDAGLTAVEYAVLAGLVVIIGGAAAFWLGQGVNRSSGRVAWASGSTSGSHASHSAAAGTQLIVTSPSAGKSSVLSWALLSLGVSVSCVGGFFGWHYLRDYVQQGRTRRLVRQSLADAGGQAALERLMRRTDRTPIVRLKKPETNLIGRNSPDLHHWMRGRDLSKTGQIADADITPRSLHHATEIPESVPAMPVAG